MSGVRFTDTQRRGVVFTHSCGSIRKETEGSVLDVFLQPVVICRIVLMENINKNNTEETIKYILLSFPIADKLASALQHS